MALRLNIDSSASSRILHPTSSRLSIGNNSSMYTGLSYANIYPPKSNLNKRNSSKSSNSLTTSNKSANTDTKKSGILGFLTKSGRNKSSLTTTATTLTNIEERDGIEFTDEKGKGYFSGMIVFFPSKIKFPVYILLCSYYTLYKPTDTKELLIRITSSTPSLLSYFCCLIFINIRNVLIL